MKGGAGDGVRQKWLVRTGGGEGNELRRLNLVPVYVVRNVDDKCRKVILQEGL